MQRKIRLLILFLALFPSFSFAQLENITAGLTSLCSFISDLLPVVAMTLVVGAGAVYAGGQLMGAETRARANVWATTLITGALIGILISVVSPTILGVMYGPTWDDSCAQGGNNMQAGCAPGTNRCDLNAGGFGCCDPATEICNPALGCEPNGPVNPCVPNPCGARNCCQDAGQPDGYYCTNMACA